MFSHFERWVPNDEFEKGSKSVHDEKVPADTGYVGRIEIGKGFHTLLKHALEPYGKWERNLEKNESAKKVLNPLHHHHAESGACV